MFIVSLTAAIFSFTVISSTSLEASALNDSSEWNTNFPHLDSEFYLPLSTDPDEYYSLNGEYSSASLNLNPYFSDYEENNFEFLSGPRSYTGFLPGLEEYRTLVPNPDLAHYTKSASPDLQYHNIQPYAFPETREPLPSFSTMVNALSPHSHYSSPAMQGTYHSSLYPDAGLSTVPSHPMIYPSVMSPSHVVRQTTSSPQQTFLSTSVMSPSYIVKPTPVNNPHQASSPSPVVSSQTVAPKSKLESHLEDALLNRSKMNVEVIMPEESYHKLAESFPYELTSDQIKGIGKIEEELASGRPMNHMVVGDVGFGKTELALRAACLVSLKGKQVVVVAPRKTLARQHYNDFSTRLSPLGIDVINFSVSKVSEQRKRDTLIKGGNAQVIVGTSALFNAKAKFNNLGLIIIDEEQLFGVKQKETLKAQFKDAHVLWMSATPIPRTFNLIKKGLMSLSELKTPPVGRVNTQTFSIDSSDVELKKMAQKEFDRDGQIYYVTHKISPNIDEAYTRWTTLFPEKKIVMLHGEMKDTQKHEVMENFRMGTIDVLVCTKIVSVGLNVPKANSIFIEDPTKFGTSELVQLRGRVGRSTTQAYAYLINTDEPSLKVQKFIETASIGGGVELAKHDAEERGFGEILGEKQNDRTKSRTSKAPNPKRQRTTDYFQEAL
ncbi:MAG: DEAD/DEAH box helicase [Candidatus Nucleicultricaceae bacterium]